MRAGTVIRAGGGAAVWPPRSGKAPEDAVLSHQGVRVDLLRHRAFADDREVFLTLTEFRVLACLLREPGRACPYAELADLAGRGGGRNFRSMHQHIRALRRKLGCPALIETVRGFGFRLGTRTRPGSRAHLPP